MKRKLDSRGQKYQRQRDARRNTSGYRKKRQARREVTGVLDRKKSLKYALLNVNGLTPDSYEDVKDTFDRTKPDVCFLLETKRREEDIGSDVDIPGYTLREVRRSDTAGDKGGGGLAVYTRELDGLVFQEYNPAIVDKNCHFVRNERIWITTESSSFKSAVCGAYFGCQYPDNRNEAWNTAMYTVIHEEAMLLKSQGYGITILADFNGHIGCQPGVGITGNNPDINRNGQLLLNFIQVGGFKHVNGEQNLTTGLWTRQRGTSRSVLDLALVCEEDLRKVESLKVDDKGEFGGSSDHNWLFLNLKDSFVKKRRILNNPTKKPGWKISPDMDWGPFKDEIKNNIVGKHIESMDVEQLSTLISRTLLESGTKTIGMKSNNIGKSKPKKLPHFLVQEFRLKRKLEQEWKSASTSSTASASELKVLEDKFLAQKTKASESLFLYNNRDREKVKKECSGNTTSARKSFWQHVTSKVKQSSDINGVVDPESGVLKCSREEIAELTEKHLNKVFNGISENTQTEENISLNTKHMEAHVEEHSYCVNNNPKLPKINNSCLLTEDPGGWLDRDYTVEEVKQAASTMHGGRAKGWDNIPNEFIINAPDELFSVITALFNRIKKTGVTPAGWNKGRVTLIFKKGLRESLGNYRPITVLISLSGLYSRVLNARLTEVVESHKLLGEDQNGFRKGRRMADNSFILDSILWKAKSKKQKVHLCYVDITKAYDSVNRNILWTKLASMGFGGQFLQSLKSLYTGDSLVCTVNGVSTGQVYPQRGLRQGCSLSPLLFALYISEIGKDLSTSTLGFPLGGMTVSVLCFADDIVLFAKKADGLRHLIGMVKAICDKLKLEISISKSNVVSPEDQEVWDILDQQNEVVLSLKSVLSYKYLGTETTLQMGSTATMRQQKSITTAKRYKFACYYLAKTGPDVVDMAIATWSNIAIPSILTGCEVIPFSDATIEAIERLQSQLAKSILGLRQTAPNICAQTELGFKPFRMLLWKHQLGFYQRLIKLPGKRWASRALSEHLAGTWSSPYVAYITRIMEKIKMFDILPTERGLDLHLNEWAINETNRKISMGKLPCISPITEFSRQSYVYEQKQLSIIAEFRLSCAGLGNKAPNNAGFRSKDCILCSRELNEQHVAFTCPEIEKTRRQQTSISTFRNQCRLLANDSIDVSYAKFVNGQDVYGVKIPRSAYKDRGHMLFTMKNTWLRLTGYKVYSIVLDYSPYSSNSSVYLPFSLILFFFSFSFFHRLGVLTVTNPLFNFRLK